MTPVLRAASLLLALLLAGGCALIAPPEPPPTLSVLDQMPTELPHRNPRRGTLLVYPLEARPLYDTTQMAYTLRAHRVAYFARNQWAEPPARMLQPLLLRALEGTGAFAAVITPPHTGGPVLSLRTEVVDLLQDFTQEPPVLRLTLRVQLDDDGGKRVLATREIRLQQVMAEKAPAAGVLAANEAGAQALREVAAFVLQHAP